MKYKDGQRVRMGNRFGTIDHTVGATSKYQEVVVVVWEDDQSRGTFHTNDVEKADE